MYYIYILLSIHTGKHYVGSTADIVARLAQHNSGSSRFTRAYRPWQIIYSEQFDTKAEALQRERQIKSYKGGRAFKALLKSVGYGEVA